MSSTEQTEVQKSHKKKNHGREKKNSFESKRSNFEGAIKELGVFTYQNDRMSAEAFNSAKQSVIDYLNIKNPHAGYALEHRTHFKFEIPASITDAAIKKHAQDQIGKLIASYHMSELPEAYGVLIGQCDPSLRAAMEELDEFETEIHMKRDLLRLWTVIADKCLNPIRSDLNSHISFINRIQAATKKFEEFYQGSRESIAEFYRKFKTEVIAAESCGVTFINSLVLDTTVINRLEALQEKALDEYVKGGGNANSQEARDLIANVAVPEDQLIEIQTDLKERALAYEFIKKLNRTIYQDMQVELANRLNDGIDEYPTTVLQARRRAEGRIKSISRNNIPIQNSVAFNTVHSNPKKGNKKPKGNNSSSNKPRKCYFCNQEGHVQTDCHLYKEAQESFRAKVQPSNLTIGLHEAEPADAGFCVLCPAEETALVSRPAMILDNDILLDNQATVSVFHYKSYLRNIRPAPRPVKIVGVGGQLTATQVGDFGTFGAVYYHPNAVANILCFSDVTKFYDTRYDASKDVFVIVNKKNGKEIEFGCKNKLYVWNPSSRIEESILVQTVQDNMLSFTKREVQDAQEARSTFIKLGRPAMKDFIDMVRTGRLLNCPFSVKDIERASIIYGPDLGSLKGRSLRSPPDHIKIETNVPKELIQEIVLSGDIFYLFGIPFLVTKSRKLKLIAVQHLEDGKDHNAILKGFKSVMQLYNKHNFKITHFISDTEAGLQRIEGALNELGITYVPASKNQHVGEVERCIRQVKERVRAFVNTLPYLLTKLMVLHVVYFCVRMINSIPHEGDDQSPRELLTGKKLDFKTDCKIEFGAYAQVNEDNSVTNTMASRTVGAICLGPSNESSSSYRFLSLLTWKIITRGSWTILPIPPEVIDIISKKAIEDDAKGHLKKHPIAKALAKKNKKVPTAGMGKSQQKSDQIDGIAGTELELPDDSSSSDDSSLWSAATDEPDKQRFEDYVTSDDDSDAEVSEDSNDEVDEVVNLHIESPTPDALHTSRIIENIQDSFKTFGNIFNVSMHDTNEGLKSLGCRNYAKFLRRKHQDDIDESTVQAVLTQLSVKAGIKQWGAKAIVAAMEELRQLILKDVFIFVERKHLIAKQQKAILRTLLFLKEKRDGRLKGRCCVDGRPQAFMEQIVDPFSPTVSTETFFISTVVDSHEERDVATADIEGAYLTVDMLEEDVYVELEPVLSAIVVAMFPHLAKFLDDQGRLTAKLGKALYGCIQSARMFYEHLKNSLLAYGFVPNPYEPCIFNKTTESGLQVTVTIYVDDVKISCKDPRAVDDVLEYLRSVYRTISVKRGKVLEYLGMSLNFEEKGKVKISMANMVKEITKEIPEGIHASTPGDLNLFKPPREDDTPCSDSDKVLFHSVVAKLLYVAKKKNKTRYSY